MTRRDRERWEAVDWSQSKRAIADLLGVDPETVRYHRNKRGTPSARALAVEAFKAFVTVHRDDLHKREVAQVVREAGVELDVQSARRIMRAAGVEAYRHPGGATVPSTFPDVDWALPSVTLAAVWGPELRDSAERTHPPEGTAGEVGREVQGGHGRPGILGGGGARAG